MLTKTDENLSLELFFELSEDLLCIAGYDGYFKKINPAVSKVLGYSIEELMAKPINEFVHPDDRNITAKYRSNLHQSIPLLNFDNRYCAKNGDTVWLSWTSIPVEDKQLVFAIAKNITHRHRMEEERNLLLSELTKSNSDLKQLGYTTSHDLRSPVNNLLSLLSFLDVSNTTDSANLELIDALRITTEGLKTTLNNYIEDFSNNDRLKIEIEEVDINSSLINVMHSIGSLVQDSKITIQTDFSALAFVRFNRAFLESIFLNLLTNSIKYAQPEHRPVVTVKTVIQDDGVKQLVFADNGLGFDMEKIKGRIFGLNQTFHAHNDSKGVGLYLVYNHITSLGGSISLESEIDKGAKFTITFKD